MSRRLRVAFPYPNDWIRDGDEVRTSVTPNRTWILREAEVLRRKADLHLLSTGVSDFNRTRYDVLYSPCELTYNVPGLAALAGKPAVLRFFVGPPKVGDRLPVPWPDIFAMLRGAALSFLTVVANTMRLKEDLEAYGVSVAGVIPQVAVPGCGVGDLEPRFTFLGRAVGKGFDDLLGAARIAGVPLRVGLVGPPHEVALASELVAGSGVDVDVWENLPWSEVVRLIDSSVAVVSGSSVDTFWQSGIEALARGRDCRLIGNEYTASAYGPWVNAGSVDGLAEYMRAGHVAGPEQCRVRLRDMGSDPGGYLGRLLPILERASAGG
ncbi:MAG: hypothetical protein ABH877_04705, partial [bacterium]